MRILYRVAIGMIELAFDLMNYSPQGRVEKRTAARGIARRDGKYLMVVGSSGACRFPGGGVEPGESLADAMCREVKEESGYSVRKGSAREYAVVRERRKGLIADILEMDSNYFLCEVEGPGGEQALDEGEAADGLRPVWMGLEEALAVNRRLENAGWKVSPRVMREILVMECLLEEGGMP